MTKHTDSLSVLKSEYDATLKLARDRGVTLTRHPDIDKLVENDQEDLDFIKGQIDHIRQCFLLVPPPRR
jgi:hypothetical protein